MRELLETARSDVPWYRPARTLVDAHGATWEIYVTRTRIGQWKGVDTPDVDPIFDHGGYGWFLLVPAASS